MFIEQWVNQLRLSTGLFVINQLLDLISLIIHPPLNPEEVLISLTLFLSFLS